MDFQKVIYENVEKNPFISRQIYRSETFLSFMKFYFVHIVHYVHILKNSYYAYIPPYMHKSLLTLGDKKEQQQIEFYEKLSRWFSYRRLKVSKCSISLARLGECSKSKVATLSTSCLCETRTSFCTWLISPYLTSVFNWLYFTQCHTSFSSIDHLPCHYVWFLILFHPAANVFIFGDFNIHHKDWLTYSGGTDRPGELCYYLK